VTLIVSNSSLKQSCSVSISVSSALEVNFNNMCYMNLHFLTLLTYLHLHSSAAVCFLSSMLKEYTLHIVCTAFEILSVMQQDRRYSGFKCKVCSGNG